MTKAAQEKADAAAKAKAKAKAKKQAGDDSEADDAYTALSKVAWVGPTAKPIVGNFETCPKCQKQFTVVRHSCSAPFYCTYTYGCAMFLDKIHYGR